MAEAKPSNVDRRDFLRNSAAAGAVLSLSAASYASVAGANEKIGIAILGCGGRAQAHINTLLKLRKEGRAVSIVGVCDVWDGQEDTFDHEFPVGTITKRNYSQGLYPSARKCGLNLTDSARVTKDYRRLLELKSADIICVATPDHWHAKMTLDAMTAGKDVYCEKPMTRTTAEAQAVVDAARKLNRVVVVGVQSLADPTWARAHDLIRTNRIGPVVMGQTGFHRNDIRGQWRYYRLTPQMSPKTIDWKMFVGHGFEVNGQPISSESDLPFDRAKFAQWRCYWPFSGGVFTDLLTHKTTQFLAATGLRYPRRVMAAGGLFWEHDGRDVPDVGTLIADFDEGTQLQFTATTISGYPVEEILRGRLGTMKFVKNQIQLIRDDPMRGSGLPQRLEKSLDATESIDILPVPNETQAMWEHFIECVRTRHRQTLCPPELGAAASTIAALGVESFRTGQMLLWDKDGRRPATSNGLWAANWEHRSQQRERFAGLQPPKYMSLAGETD